MRLPQHTTFTRANPGTSQLRTFGQRQLGFLGQRTKTHVRDKQRHFQAQRLVRVRPDHQLRCHRRVIHQRCAVQLSCENLYVVPRRQTLAWYAHRIHRPVRSNRLKATFRHGVNVLKRRFFLGIFWCRRVVLSTTTVWHIQFGDILGQLCVRTITKRCITRLLTAAQPSVLLFFYRKNERSNPCSCVGAVTKGLVFRTPALTPVVFLIRLQGHFNRGPCRNLCFLHTTLRTLVFLSNTRLLRYIPTQRYQQSQVLSGRVELPYLTLLWAF